MTLDAKKSRTWKPDKWFITYAWRANGGPVRWEYGDRIVEEHPLLWLASAREKYRDEVYVLVCMYRVPHDVAEVFEEHQLG